MQLPDHAIMMWRCSNGLGLIAERHRTLFQGFFEYSKGYEDGLWELSVVEYKRWSYRKVCNSVLGADSIAVALESITGWLEEVKKLPGYVAGPKGAGKKALLRAEYEELAIGLEALEAEVTGWPARIAQIQAGIDIHRGAMSNIKKEWVAEGFRDEIL